MSHFPLIDAIVEWPEDKLVRYDLGDHSFTELLAHFRRLKEMLELLAPIDSRDLLQPHLKELEEARSLFHSSLHWFETADDRVAANSWHSAVRHFHERAYRLSSILQDILFWVGGK